MKDQGAIWREILARTQYDLDVIDLHSVARMLQPIMPDASFTELTRLSAEEFVQRGYRYLVWDPNQLDDNA